MADSITLYGIPNCDTVKKARRWLDAHSVSYDFHDYKKKGIDEATLSGWCTAIGWETLLNRRGTTWRKLDEASKSDLTEASAIALMIDNTSLIKRPVLETGNQLLAGFDEAAYKALIA
jgi:arsenate reductase (glutaredoxin)